MQQVHLIDQRRQALRFLDRIATQDQAVVDPGGITGILSGQNYLLYSGFVTIRLRGFPPRHGMMINRRNRSQRGEEPFENAC